MLKVAMVNTEKNRGGAARMASLLAKSMDANISELDVRFYHCEDDIIAPPFYGLKRFASRQINAGLARLGGSTCVFDFGVAKKIIELTADMDILHVHNLHGYYLDWQHLFDAWKDRPVVWTWHDQWGATGRCGFAIGCEGWTKGCPKCPNLRYAPAAIIDRASHEYEAKSMVYRKMKNLNIVSPSCWLADIAIARGFNADKVSVLPNPVDLSVYLSRGKLECRRELGIPDDQFVALFVAAECNEVRKGYNDFAEVTKNLDIYPLAVGGLPKNISEHVHHAGEVREQAKLAVYYGSADVMVFTSKADNYPNTVIESLVCGTPIVAYDVGGVSSQLDSIYSQLVSYGDITGMRECLERMKASGGKDSGMEARLGEYAKGMWADNIIVNKYADEYRRITVLQ